MEGGRQLRALIDVDATLILAVIKFVFLFDRAAAHSGAGGGAGVLGKHCICMAFTSKIGA
jgi:hypothetical protein